MDIKERIKMIDNKIKNDAVKKKTEEARIKQRVEECKNTIYSLQNRIADLLEFAWYAIDNGINLNKKGWGGHEGYDTGMFFSNGWSHIVGIKDRKHLGITKGGACGYIDFYTDGVEIYGFDTHAKMKVEPLLYDMEYFIRRFDELESSLYQYVEKQCTE